MKSYDTKDAGMNLRLKLKDNVSFNSFNYLMNERYSGVSSMFAYQGDLRSEGMRFFSVNNLNIYSQMGVSTLNYGYNYERKDVHFGNNKMHTKDFFHFVSLNHKKEIVEHLTLQVGLSWDKRMTSE